MIKKLVKSTLKKSCNLIGYDLIFRKKNKNESVVAIDKNVWEPYFMPDQKMRLYFEGLKHARNEWSDNFYKQLRFYSLQQIVRHVLRQELSGDFAECGVWKGQSAYIISSILSERVTDKKLHIFDSFEGGLSEKIEEDVNLRSGLSEKEIREESNMFSSTEDEVMSCLNGFPFIRLYKGWIPGRFNEVKDGQFSFVHIDVDLYEPTRDSLEFFYPRLVKGGAIVCDDYGFTQFPGAKKAVNEFLKKNNYEIFYEVPMGGCFIIK